MSDEHDYHPDQRLTLAQTELAKAKAGFINMASWALGVTMGIAIGSVLVSAFRGAF